jgi:stage II sporulation protein R
MDGVFMRKFLCTCLILALVLGVASLIADRQRLYEDVIRLHVVGASDSDGDQAVKLQVRDAVTAALEDAVAALPDAEAAYAYLQTHLAEIEKTANAALESAGVADRASVSLGEEAFPTRQYDTFALPAGVYRSLRIRIGEAGGRNWWCVVFPGLCVSATTDGFADTAAGAGFSDTLTDTLQQEQGYEVRFFLLDCLGWLQNWLFDR